MSNKINKILKEYVDGLYNIIGSDLKNVILYGSYARGEQSKGKEISDIDIMIIVDTDDEKIKQIENEVISYSYELDLKYNILLSPIIDSLKNYNDRVKYISFYKNVQKEGVLLNA